MSNKLNELEKIVKDYHLNTEIKDKFIEDICQIYCCDWLSKFINTQDDVIELGFGEGIITAQLSKLAGSYTVVEGAKSLIEVLRVKLPKVIAIHSLFEDYIPEHKYNILLALHIFEHVDNPIRLAKLLKTWIKKDGEIIVIVPNRDSIHRKLAVIMGLQPELDTLSKRDHLVGHQRVYNFEDLEHDLLQAGLEVIERKGFFLKTLPNSMMMNCSPELIMALNQVSEELPQHLLANIGLRVRLISK